MFSSHIPGIILVTNTSFNVDNTVLTFYCKIIYLLSIFTVKKVWLIDIPFVFIALVAFTLVHSDLSILVFDHYCSMKFFR